MNYYEIGQRIRKLRKANRLSQEQLAEKINISVTHMSHIETGNTKLSLPVLVDIAETLRVRADELINTPATYSTSDALGEIAKVLEGCSPEESQAIVDVAKATKQAMDKYLK